ncbi:MAG: cytochrome C [Bdellovibrio sp.]|nr:MAG: cytochrome C [Bdellovibrio sp.]
MKKIIMLMIIASMYQTTVKAAEGNAAEGNSADGKRKAAACVACHGAEGISINPLWPNLAKQKPEYLVKQLTDFYDGKRNDPVMSPMAKTLTEQDRKDIAAYFSSL